MGQRAAAALAEEARSSTVRKFADPKERSATSPIEQSVSSPGVDRAERVGPIGSAPSLAPSPAQSSARWRDAGHVPALARGCQSESSVDGLVEPPGARGVPPPPRSQAPPYVQRVELLHSAPSTSSSSSHAPGLGGQAPHGRLQEVGFRSAPARGTGSGLSVDGSRVHPTAAGAASSEARERDDIESLMWLQPVHSAPCSGWRGGDRFDLAGDAAPGGDNALAEDSLGVPTVGSAMHRTGNCKPCLFWYKGLCHKGPRCLFCHIRHSDAEVSKVRPSKKTRNLLQQSRGG